MLRINLSEYKTYLDEQQLLKKTFVIITIII